MITVKQMTIRISQPNSVKNLWMKWHGYKYRSLSSYRDANLSQDCVTILLCSSIYPWGQMAKGLTILTTIPDTQQGSDSAPGRPQAYQVIDMNQL